MVEDGSLGPVTAVRTLDLKKQGKGVVFHNLEDDSLVERTHLGRSCDLQLGWKVLPIQGDFQRGSWRTGILPILLSSCSILPSSILLGFQLVQPNRRAKGMGVYDVFYLGPLHGTKRQYRISEN